MEVFGSVPNDFNWLTAILTTFAVILLILKASVDQSYWRRAGVPQVRSKLFLGNAKDLILGKKNLSYVADDIYRKLEGQRYGGFYMMDRPCLILRDADLVWQMNLKDSDNYAPRGAQMKGTNTDPITKYLYRIEERHWLEYKGRMLRAFGQKNTERMSFLFEECSQRMVHTLKESFGCVGWRDVDLTSVCSRYATDVIGSCGFGIECGAINDPRSQFLELGIKAMCHNRWKNFCSIMLMWNPLVANIFSLRLFSRDVYEFFKGVVADTLKYRENKKLLRADFIHELLELKHNGFSILDRTSEEYPNDALVSDVFATFGYSIGMTGNAMSFCIHELTLDAEVQTRARMEVDVVLKKHRHKLCYEAVQEMKYLDMILNETLRLYPITGTYMEECCRPYSMDGANLTVESGVCVLAPYFSLQRDARYYPDPLRFNPERFSPENTKGRHPALFLPYGFGLRRCPAENFSRAVMKIGLAALLSQFELTRCPRTPARPVGLHPHDALPSPAEPIVVRISPRAWVPCD